MNIRLVEKFRKKNIKNPIRKLTIRKKYNWKGCKPIILRDEAFEYFQEVKRFLPDGEITEFELATAKKLFLQRETPKMIVRQLISFGCCKF